MGFEPEQLDRRVRKLRGCPKCKAAKGVKCVGADGKPKRGYSHPHRALAAFGAAEYQLRKAGVKPGDWE